MVKKLKLIDVIKFVIVSLVYFCIHVNLMASHFETPEIFIKNKSSYKALVFLSESCPCSRSHIDHLNELSKSQKLISFFAVISEPYSESNKLKVETYFSKNNFQFPIIYDPEQVLVKKYNALKTPHVSLIKITDNKESIIYQGGVTNKRNFTTSNIHYLKLNVNAITSNKPLPYSSGHSMGCYIRRL